MKKFWKQYLENAFTINSILFGIDLGLLVGMVFGVAIILAYNTGII